jgi:chromosome segregation ATPase
MIPQGGRLHSDVLDLDVGLMAGRLRFFQGTAEIPDATELIVRLEGLVDELEERYEKAERAKADLGQAQTNAEQAKADAEQAKANAEQRAAALEAELSKLRGGSPASSHASARS